MKRHWNFSENPLIQKEVLDSKHPNLAASYNNIALTYRSLGQYEKALEFQQKLDSITNEVLHEDHSNQQAISNNLIGIYEGRALHYYREKRFHQALIDFKITNKDQQTSSNWIYIGLCHYYLRNYTKAIEAYQQAANLNPEIKSQHFYNNMDAVYIKTNNLKKPNPPFKPTKNYFQMKADHKEIGQCRF